MLRATRRTVFAYLDRVRERPDMYIVHRLRELELQVHGYYAGLAMHGVIEDAPNMTRHFSEWLRAQTDWSLSAGWADAIERHAEGRPPLDVLFDFIDRYRKLRPVTVATAKLGPRNAPTGKRVIIGYAGRMERPSRVDIVRYAPSAAHFLRLRYPERVVDESLGSLRGAKQWAADELSVRAGDWRRVTRAGG